MRLAARTDAVQAEIVKALRKIGARCFYIKEPVDLLVGFRSHNILLEVKSAGGTLTQAQKDFLATWPGEAHVVHTVDEAIGVVTQARY